MPGVGIKASSLLVQFADFVLQKCEMGRHLSMFGELDKCSWKYWFAQWMHIYIHINNIKSVDDVMLHQHPLFG